MMFKLPKIDAYSALLGGGVVLTLWYLLADHPAPNYAEPIPTSPLPPSLQNLPPPPPAGQV
jgi:hypothetical protein